MIRWTVALALLLGWVPCASAIVVPAPGDPGAERDLARTQRQLARAPEAPQPELIITSDTEIKVDGRACRLDEVPAGAEIILIDVNGDRGVIRRLHFQTPKK
jgi:hypothetical protein